MPKKEEYNNKKSVSDRKAEIGRRERKLFRAVVPAISIEVLNPAGESPLIEPAALILLSLSWYDNGIKRSRSLRLGKKAMDELLKAGNEVIRELLEDELRSRLKRRLLKFIQPLVTIRIS